MARQKGLDRFYKVISGTQNELIDYLPVISSSGELKKITDLDVILSSWSNILITPLGTYLFDPTFGSELYKQVWEPTDVQTQEKIESEIRRRLRQFDDRATVEEVQVSFFPNQKGFEVNVIVNFGGEQRQLDVVISEESYFNFIRTGI